MLPGVGVRADVSETIEVVQKILIVSGLTGDILGLKLMKDI
jgi:hypothetical protein